MRQPPQRPKATLQTPKSGADQSDILKQILSIFEPIRNILARGEWQAIGVFLSFIIAAAPLFFQTPALIKAFFVGLGIIMAGAIFVVAFYMKGHKIISLSLAVAVLFSTIAATGFVQSSGNQSDQQGPGGTVAVYRHHHGTINRIVWSPDGKNITSYSYDGTVQTWESITGNTLKERNYYDQTLGAEVTEVPSPDGKLVASSSILPAPPYSGIRFSKGVIRMFDAITGVDILPHDRDIYGYINQLVWSPDQKSGLIASSNGGTISVWNARTGKDVRLYTGNDINGSPTSDFIYGLAWSPDGRFIASSGADGEMQIWEATTGKLYIKYPGHCPGSGGQNNGFIYNIDWLADGPGTSRMTLGCSEYGQEQDVIVKILSVSINYYVTGDQFFSIDDISQTALCHLDTVDPSKGNYAVWVVSPDDKYIAYFCRDNSTISIWDIAGNRDVLTYTGHISTVKALAWSPDGQYIASGSSDGLIRVWRTGEA